MDIEKFISAQQLQSSYKLQIQHHFMPLAQQLANSKQPGQALFITINGAQGSGKSTLAAFLAQALQQRFALHTCACSIDDFYFPRAVREQLAQSVHPLFATRGVPGTHDIALLNKVIARIQDGARGIRVPRFNKATDDREPLVNWPYFERPIDVFILEGWCVGAQPQSPCELNVAVNSLEQNQDPDGRWRRCVNSRLANEYQGVFNAADIRIMLKAPSFDTVQAWRWQQEQQLIARHGASEHTLDEQGVKSFISYFERLTRHCLAHLPAHCDVVYHLDNTRHIYQCDNKLATQGSAFPVVFTDLDGTLLDHHSYQCDEAKPLLNALSQAQVPVVVNSSKTAAEIHALCQALHLDLPFICENGAALYVPKGHFITPPKAAQQCDNYWIMPFAPPLGTLQQCISALAEQFGDSFRSFSQLSSKRLSALTGLTGEALTQAQTRHYSDPFYWQGSDKVLHQFTLAAQKLGCEVLRGGRFVHLSLGVNKGKALHYVMQMLAPQYSCPLHSIALGDSHNDVAMLEAADTAIVIANSENTAPILKKRSALFSVHAGPRGWQETLSSLALIKEQLAADEVRNHG
ncbi:d-glycerate 3-kinase, plant type [Pseudoalteromonas sp. SW0106-04]|uniref:HAD-IIB family hydrolase n=1 Tax=Pseudoalteromonas sp. SW0106-04 TaxID=1702169 RepID=UPI0006B41F18|nr:HAD-IIB family hydrolase [Pseudoalteromonas sp. SW0106-04]GAP74470.1 d-glycerate 3-kinase, plant type [Pseudoalteromonas sp. SW0106-04]